MGKSSTSLKKKHSKISSKSKSSSRSKNRKSKSKKVRRHEVSLSSSDYEDSKNMDISVSSSSEDRSKRKRDRSRTRKDVKSRKKRLRRRSCSSDSSEDSLFARKRKKVKRKNKYDETREKSRRKKKVKTEASVNSVSSGSRSCSICPAGIDSNDNVEYERSRGRTERKEKDKRQLRGRSGSAKSSRYRARSCSPCSSPHGECNYGGTEEKYVPENKTRWLRSVITVVNEGDESRQLSGNETKEEIVDDLDYPCRSNDSNDHGSNRELDHHQSHRAPEEELRAKDDTGDVNGDVNFTEPKLSGMSSLEVCAGTNESIKEETNDVSGVLNDVDLELILRQRALENLRKFRGQVQSHAKASEQENKIVSQMKQPITEKEELVQDKPNISNVAILATKFGKQTPVEETSLPVGRRNLVTYPKIDGGNLNVDKEMSGSAKIQMASAPEKVVDADSHSEVVTTPPESCNDSLQSRSSLKQTIVSGLPREKLVLAESIKNEGTFEAARITSHCGSDNVKDIKGVPSAGPKSSTLEPKFKHNNLDKGKDVANDHSQFKSKQTSDSREPSNATLPVSEADEERNAAKTTQSSIQNIDGSARDIVESCNAESSSLIVLPGFPKSPTFLLISSERVVGTMGKDAKAGGKGKGKQAASGSDENASKGKGKGGKAADGLGTCTYVKARHVLCEKQGKINEAYKKLQDGWLSNGDKVPPAEFAKVAQEYSECPSGKKGGDLGWFPRGKMAGPFQEVAFNTPVGATSAPFKSTHGYHIILSEGRKN